MRKSGILDKEKRQKRFEQKKRHIDRQVKVKKSSYSFNKYGETIQPHRFHKMNAMDCGVTGCIWCGNPRRVWGDKTRQEEKFECSAVEQIKRNPIGKWEWEDLNDPAIDW